MADPAATVTVRLAPFFPGNFAPDLSRQIQEWLTVAEYGDLLGYLYTGWVDFDVGKASGVDWLPSCLCTTCTRRAAGLPDWQ